MSATVLDLNPDPTERPIVRLTLGIIKDAVLLNADAILLELDKELHLKFLEEWEVARQSLREKSLTKEQFMEQLFFELGKLPNACEVIYVIGGKREQMTPLNGELFGNFVNILLLATGIPPWTKGEVHTSFETIKPRSKWTFESRDITRRVEFKRIR
jgi:hypothetical protein